MGELNAKSASEIRRFNEPLLILSNLLHLDIYGKNLQRSDRRILLLPTEFGQKVWCPVRSIVWQSRSRRQVG